MSDPQTPNVDAVVIGAGFGGIYMLHKLRVCSIISARNFFAIGVPYIHLEVRWIPCPA